MPPELRLFWTSNWAFLEGAGLALTIVLLNWLLRGVGRLHIRPMEKAISEEIEENLQVKTFGRTNQDHDLILAAKFHDVNQRAKHHFTMVTELAVCMFMQAMMVSSMSGIAAVTLFLLSRDGWKADNLALLILFAATATAAAIYAALAKIFRVTENFRANALAYMNVMQLGDQIRTYAYTGEAQGTEPIGTFLTRIDKSLAAYRTIAFNFDLAQAPAVSALLSELVTAAKKPHEDRAKPRPGELPDEPTLEEPTKVRLLKPS
jgi:hypothetical protein